MTDPAIGTSWTLKVPREYTLPILHIHRFMDPSSFSRSDVNGCALIKDDCTYKNGRDHTVTVVDFPALLGEFAEQASQVLEVGVSSSGTITVSILLTTAFFAELLRVRRR